MGYCTLCSTLSAVSLQFAYSCNGKIILMEEHLLLLIVEKNHLCPKFKVYEHNRASAAECPIYPLHVVLFIDAEQ